MISKVAFKYYIRAFRGVEGQSQNAETADAGEEGGRSLIEC